MESKNVDLLPWTEKYRPKKLSEIVGQEDVIGCMEDFVKHRNMPNLLLVGPPGVGKTTATIALASELFRKDVEGNVLTTNASDERGIDVIRGKVKDFARSVTLGDVPFKIVFLDEADALTPEAQHAMRRTMEAYASVSRFVLSANYSSKIIEPIQSRCAVLRFITLRKEDVEKMIKRIAKEENLKVDDEATEALYYISEGDMRKAINILQSISFHTKHITEKVVYKIGGAAHPKEVREMLLLALDGNFVDARKQLNSLLVNYGLSGEDIIVQIYREVYNLDISEKMKIRLVDVIGEYNFRLVEGANERIQLEALLAQFPLLKE